MILKKFAKKQNYGKLLPKCNATKKAFVFIKLNDDEKISD